MFTYRHFGRETRVSLTFLFGLVAIVSCSGNNETLKVHRVTHRAWLDMYIGRKYAGRIEIGLFGRTVPITVNNFVTLATRPPGQGYKGSKFHLTDRTVIAGGDWVAGDGSQGKSCYDTDDFDDENFEIKHYGAGWVSSYSTEENHQTSLFLITLQRISSFDGRYVVFGKVIKGMDVVRKISQVPMNNEGVSTDVIIGKCGAELADPPFLTPATDATD